MPVPQRTLLLKPTGGACPVRCTYCFYWTGHHAQAAMMPLRVVERIVPWARQAEDPHVVWQGGEPLLWGLERFRAADEILSACTHALQTSGIGLDDAFADWLAERATRWHVGLSIDGPAEHHDAARRDHRGQPTHARAIEALDRLRSRGVPVIAMAVARAGIDPRELVRYFDRLELPVRWLLRIGADEADARAWEAVMAATPRDIRHLSTHDCRLSGACHTYAVIDHDGTVYPCDHFVAPAWRGPNITDRPIIEILRTARSLRVFAALKRGRASKAPCSGCETGPLCRAGCPAYGRDTPAEAAWGRYLARSMWRFAEAAGRCDPARQPAKRP